MKKVGWYHRVVDYTDLRYGYVSGLKMEKGQKDGQQVFIKYKDLL